MLKLARDTRIIFARHVQLTLRNIFWIVFSLFQPLCFLLLFAPLLEKLTGISGFGSSSLGAFVPGLLAMTALYGVAFCGFGLLDDLRLGVIERLCVTPINRSAIFLGRVLCNVMFLLVQATFMLMFAWFFGLRVSISAIALSYGLVALIGFCVATASYCAAYILKVEDALAPAINFFLLPVQLLAGIMLPMTLAPNWLQNIAFLNPLSHAVTAMRALFVGDYTNMSIVYAYIITGIFAVLAYIWGAWLFNKSEN